LEFAPCPPDGARIRRNFINFYTGEPVKDPRNNMTEIKNIVIIPENEGMVNFCKVPEFKHCGLKIKMYQIIL
jgi:hypothetical protein